MAPYTIEDAMHDLRKQIDACIKEASFRKTQLSKGAREISIVHTKLQEAKMWAGKVLEELGSELPKEFQDKSE